MQTYILIRKFQMAMYNQMLDSLILFCSDTPTKFMTQLMTLLPTWSLHVC